MMTQNLIFAGFTALALMALVATAYFYKKVDFKSVLGLFGFGALISVPFVLIEHSGLHMSYLYVIAAFVFIELGILFFEKHVSYFHELIHHNVRELRIASFLLIGLGFTYAEIGFTILDNSDTVELLSTIPFKTTYALLMHTVFASAASLIQVGELGLLAEGIEATLFRVINYYSRIGIISVSHYLYVFSIEHNLMLLIGGLLLAGIGAFFYIKRQLDLKPEAIE